MAKVYLALMGGLAGFSKLLVIKVLRRDLLGGADDGVRMFIEEARLAARLVHPNIVHTYEVGEVNGHYFMAMEYLEGQPYSELLNRARTGADVPLHEHLRIVAEVARGLHYAHQLTGYQNEPQGIVHRDVSPQNIFVTYQGQVKLLDFGIAKQQDSDHLTQVGVIKGRLDYIAPEQLHGDALDGRADIFALGAILWEAVSGQRFAGGRKVSEINKVQARIAGNERKLREVVPDVSEALATIVDRATALRREDRFEDAAAFADALDTYLEEIDQRPSAKTLSQIVTQLFATERDAIRKLIDEQMQWTKRFSVEIGDTTGNLPRLSLTQSTVSGPYGASTATFAGPPADFNPAAQSAELGLDGKQKKLRMALVGTIIAAAIGAGATLAWVQRPSGAPAAEASAPAATATAPTNAPSDAVGTARSTTGSDVDPGSIAVRLTTTPPDARISLDGVVLLAPFQGAFRKDRALHHLEVSADGYRSVRAFVSFQEDQDLAIRLEPLPAEPRAPAVGTAPPTLPSSERPRMARGPSASGAVMPGADLEDRAPAAGSDELDLDNPYLKRK